MTPRIVLDCHAYPCPCIACGHPTAPGSGRFVDRIGAYADEREGYLCPWCADDAPDPDGLAPVDPRDTYRAHAGRLRVDGDECRTRARALRAGGAFGDASRVFVEAGQHFTDAARAYARADDTPGADAMRRAAGGCARAAVNARKRAPAD